MPWIFTHGSLMAAPPFRFADRAAGEVHGWRRTFGHPSVRNWGRHGHAAPTCSLVAGGRVAGVAYRVEPDVVDQVREREAREPVPVTVTATGSSLPALTWPMTSPWSSWTPERLARAAAVNVARGGGPMGDALSYLAIVHASLRQHGQADPLVRAYEEAMAAIGLAVPDPPHPHAPGVPMGGPVE